MPARKSWVRTTSTRTIRTMSTRSMRKMRRSARHGQLAAGVAGRRGPARAAEVGGHGRAGDQGAKPARATVRDALPRGAPVPRHRAGGAARSVATGATSADLDRDRARRGDVADLVAACAAAAAD